MFVSPMLLHKTDIPFNNEEYITELKLDGIRLILSKFNNEVKLYTRHNNDVTARFPELHQIDIPNGTVLDGELIVPGMDGKPDFEAMMSRFMSGKKQHQVQFVIFDILYYENDKVTTWPLYERKELLDELEIDSKYIVVTKWMEGKAEAYFDLVKQKDLEGIVMKRADSRYIVNKRSKNWLKVINYQFTNVWISGIRKKEFGALLTDEKGHYVGMMELMQPRARKKFHELAEDHVLTEDEKFITLNPKLKCRVKYRNITKQGQLRMPSFVEWK